MDNMKLALGTAQFGLDYGISNSSGVVSYNEANNIVKCALKNGIRTFDTAHTYGDCHKILGKLLENEPEVRILTKTPNAAETDSKQIYDGMIESLCDLRRKNVDSLLLHMTNIFKNDISKMFPSLIKIKNEGLAKKIGVSVYTVKEAEKIINEFDIDIIQVPCGIFNQDFLLSGMLNKLKKMKIEVHVRSIFLQGLVFMGHSTLHEYFNPIKQKLKYFHDFLIKNDITASQMSLNFVSSIKEIDNIIVGVQKEEELKEIIESYNININIDNFESWAITDENFTNPSLWKI